MKTLIVLILMVQFLQGATSYATSINQSGKLIKHEEYLGKDSDFRRVREFMWFKRYFHKQIRIKK